MRGSATSSLTVSKCENFDPLKRALNSVFGPKTPVFSYTKKIHEELTARRERGGGGNPYGQPDRKNLHFFTSPLSDTVDYY